MYVATMRIAMPLARSSQLSATRGLLPRMAMRIWELRKVAKKITPKTAPPERDMRVNPKISSKKSHQ